MNQAKQGSKLGQLIAKCWADEAFKNRLLADPIATLKAEGAQLPPGVSIKVVEDTPAVRHLVIPRRPGELSDAQLDKVAAGVWDDTDIVHIVNNTLRFAERGEM